MISNEKERLGGLLQRPSGNYIASDSLPQSCDCEEKLLGIVINAT